MVLGRRPCRRARTRRLVKKNKSLPAIPPELLDPSGNDEDGIDGQQPLERVGLLALDVAAHERLRTGLTTLQREWTQDRMAALLGAVGELAVALGASAESDVRHEDGTVA